jgi:flagellar basal-body rod protein FlgB
MDWNSTAPFDILKQRLSWLAQRQQVLAQNVANADTPRYVPHDLEPFSFANALRQQWSRVPLAQTAVGHLPGRRDTGGSSPERPSRDAYEASPSGNAVVLEEQMTKINETAASHKLTTNLYRKYLGLVRTAANVKG